MVSWRQKACYSAIKTTGALQPRCTSMRRHGVKLPAAAELKYEEPGFFVIWYPVPKDLPADVAPPVWVIRELKASGAADGFSCGRPSSDAVMYDCIVTSTSKISYQFEVDSPQVMEGWVQVVILYK